MVNKKILTREKSVIYFQLFQIQQVYQLTIYTWGPKSQINNDSEISEIPDFQIFIVHKILLFSLTMVLFPAAGGP